MGAFGQSGSARRRWVVAAVASALFLPIMMPQGQADRDHGQLAIVVCTGHGELADRTDPSTHPFAALKPRSDVVCEFAPHGGRAERPVTPGAARATMHAVVNPTL